MTATVQTMPAPTISERLADYVVELRYEDIPRPVVEKAKDHLLHHLGLAVQGQGSRRGQQAVRLALELGRGDCTIIGERRRAGVLEAVFANSMLMGHNGLDDSILPPGVHPGVIVLPAALAIGEITGASGRELLTAIVAGYDVMTKLCSPLWTWGLAVPRRPNNVVAPFGGAATASRLFGLRRDRVADALGHAGQVGMGIAEGLEHSWAMNPLLARNGPLAALLAKAGMEAAPTIIEGRHGVYRSLFLQDVPEALVTSLATLGKEFEIVRAVAKPQMGSELDVIPTALTQRLVDDHRLAPSEVATVDVTVAAEREPRDRAWEAGLLSPSANPTNRLGALRFRVAIIIADGRTDPARFERQPDSELRTLLGRVRLRFEKGHPIRHTRVEVTTTDGRRYEAEGDSHVLPPIDRAEWLRAAGRTTLPEDQLAQLADLVDHLDDVTDVSEVMACAAPDAPSRLAAWPSTG